MSGQPSLFDDAEPTVALGSAIEVARARRRTFLRGWHPISGHPLHEHAASVLDPKAQGLRCRDCYFAGRVVATDALKCFLEQGRYITHNPTSDVRLWFPACDAHIPAPPLSGQEAP